MCGGVNTRFVFLLFFHIAILFLIEFLIFKLIITIC